MKKIITPIINYAINKAKRNKFIQDIFEAPFNLSKFPKFGEFQDSHGVKYDLLEGLRSKIRPGWEQLLNSESIIINFNKEYLLKQKSNGEIAVSKLLSILGSQGKSIANSRILEIGCHSGGTSFALAEQGAAEVWGTEFTGYKVESVEAHQKEFEKKLVEVNDDLKKIRTDLASLFKNRDKVSFLDDDICNTALEPSSFDIICSWEVLEHLHDTKAAFVSINKLLKEDGIMVHEYNPFFCINGGHSLCTLDMLWGHTQLNVFDFEDYLSKIRPNEKDKALAFYKKGVNRMTIQDLNIQLKEADLEIISILPFVKEQHLRMVNQDILMRTQRNYPNATLLDLATPRVFVIAKKAKK